MSRGASLQPGDVVGSYRVVRTLGAGGMGSVYEVVHIHIERRAALKVLALEGTKPEVATRFVNEARAANVVPHSGIVQIFEYGQLPSGTPWLLMEYVDGETLSSRIAARHRGEPPHGLDNLSLLFQLAATLAAVHERGIVHRDLKPSNIILTPDPTRPEGEQAKLLDFGIAKLLRNSLRLLPDGRPADPGTIVGAFMGTPQYMAPEQCKSAGEVDAQADVYALGVIAYELLLGRLPFEGEPLGIVARKLYEEPPPLAGHGIPAELSTLVMSMLHRDPAQRPRMAAVADTLAKLGGRGLSGAEARALRSEPHDVTPGPALRPGDGRVLLIGGLGALVGIAVAVGVWALAVRPRPDRVVVPDATAIITDLAEPALIADQSAQSDDLASVVSDQAKSPQDLAEPRRPSLPPRPGVPGTGTGTGAGAGQGPRPVGCGPVSMECLHGVSLNISQFKALYDAATKTGLRLCVGQSLILLPKPGGFLRCQTNAAVLQGPCERLVTALDGLWQAGWAQPPRIEIRCSSGFGPRIVD